MWRTTINISRNILLVFRESYKYQKKSLFSSRGRLPKSTAKLTIFSASVGVLVGAGYGGYTHYKINSRKNIPLESTEYPILSIPPKYKPHYIVKNENCHENLKLVLFQYRTCPFCCKVRAFLDYHGLNYEVVEVDAVLRQAIQWSDYKKVPILLAKVDGGYQQLLDSTAIISMLETYTRDKLKNLQEVVKFYPTNKYVNEEGRNVVDITNKYFIMQAKISNEDERKMEMEERQWRQWADQELVHLLSPNVYRSPAEALQAFKWFESVGGWKENFPSWECALMVYGGALAMWIISKRLKSRHNLQDDVRLSLYGAAEKWMDSLKCKGTTFMGGNEPNLADISVYGVLSSIEGCTAFRDLRNHTEIGKWYDAVKDAIDGKKGHVMKVNG